MRQLVMQFYMQRIYFCFRFFNSVIKGEEEILVSCLQEISRSMFVCFSSQRVCPLPPPPSSCCFLYFVAVITLIKVIFLCCKTRHVKIIKLWSYSQYAASIENKTLLTKDLCIVLCCFKASSRLAQVN